MGLKNDEPFRLVSTIEDAKKQSMSNCRIVRILLKYGTSFLLGKEGVEAAARKYEPLIKEIIQEAHKTN